MANSGAYKVYSDLPAWAKGVVVVGGIAIVYFTGKSIYKGIASKIAAGKDAKAVKDTKDEIRVVQQTGVRASYAESQYKAWADVLQKAFEGCDPLNTVPSTVYGIVKQLKNDLDWLKLVQSYGVRTHDQCGWFMGDFTGNLYAALYDDLDSGEISKVNKFLSERGITYKVG